MKSDSFLASRRSFSAVSTSRSLRSFWFSSRSSLFRRFRLMESEATSLILRSSTLTYSRLISFSCNSNLIRPTANSEEFREVYCPNLHSSANLFDRPVCVD
jgi:hypothetical protein